MEYLVKRIKSKEEITSCHRFGVQHFKWVDGPRPETYGYMGYLDGEGLYAEMFCKEKNPKRDCKDPNGRFVSHKGGRVCDDSAMEIFVGFPGEDGVIVQNSLYVNFEINANGVMYAQYGRGRGNRSFIPPEVYTLASPEAVVQEDCWMVRVLFPETFLREISGVDLSRPGAEFYCNFYKISETEEIEHYASFAPIDNEVPNFHMPQFFARAVVE